MEGLGREGDCPGWNMVGQTIGCPAHHMEQPEQRDSINACLKLAPGISIISSIVGIWICGLAILELSSHPLADASSVA